MFALVITGPPGAGKTSVLTALVDALSDDDIPHAALDVEMAVWTHPALTDEQWSRHVRTLSALHRDAGFELLLVAQTLETDDDVEQLLGAAAADEVFLVRLEAEPATLAARIAQREPPTWSGTHDLIRHARELADSMTALAGVHLVVSTEGQPPEALAARIRAACPRWLGTGPA